MHKALNIFAVAAVIALSNAAAASAQSTRTWVSSTGSDANPCTNAQPCRTFQGALGKTANLGQIVAKDAGEYGQVVIDKSVTIDGANGLGKISATAVNQPYGGVLIDRADAVVTIKGLEIHSRQCQFDNEVAGGGYGIHLKNGVVLNVSNVSIQNHNCSALGDPTRFLAYGIAVTSRSSNVEISDSSITMNGNFRRPGLGAGGGGIYIDPNGGATTVILRRSRVDNNYIGVSLLSRTNSRITLSVDESTASANMWDGIQARGQGGWINLYLSEFEAIGNGGAGLYVSGAAAIAKIGKSTILHNMKGISRAAGGVIQSFGDNEIFGNRQEETPTSTITRK